MDLVQLTIQIGIVVTLSAVDYDRVAAQQWVIFNKYLFCGKLGVFLHHYIMGPRPADVPEDYVLDHANRQKHDVSRPNLRWVTRSFNNWNRIFTPSLTKAYLYTREGR